MPIKKILLIIFIALLPFNVFALEGYGQIINTTVIPDFALGVFPVGVWSEFGIRGLELIPKQETKLQALLKTELQVRSLSQYPTTGAIINNSNNIDLHYYVFLSEVTVNFAQSFYRSPTFNNNFLTVSGGLKMHWEQAFRAFNLFSADKNNSVFDNPEFFPTINTQYIGTPDLIGKGTLLTNSLDFGISIRDFYSSFSYNEGYYVNINMSLAPWFLANNIPFVLDTYSDFIKFSIDGAYSKLLFQADFFGSLSGYLEDSFNYQYLSGSAVPKFAQSLSFNGSGLVFYNQILLNSVNFVLKSPEFLLEANHVSLIFKFNEGIAFGTINNTLAGGIGFDHLGSVGTELKLDLLNMFHFSISLDYVYDNVNTSTNGIKFGMSGYFAYSGL